MDASRFRFQPIATSLSSALGLLALGGGIYGLVNPIGFSETIGIPITSPDSPALPFSSFTAARNFGSGLTILVLAYSGQRKAIGTLLMCGVVTAAADAWICAKFGAVEGKAIGHFIMGTALGILGAAQWYWG